MDSLDFNPFFTLHEGGYLLVSPKYKIEQQTKTKDELRLVANIDEFQAVLLSQDKDLSSDGYNIVHVCPKSGKMLVNFYDVVGYDEEVVSVSPPSVALPNGIYTATNTSQGLMFNDYSFNTDQYISLTGDLVDVKTEIDRFIGSRQKYLDNGLLHKRGILLYGPPGNGKTMFIENLVQSYKDQAVVVFLSSLKVVEHIKDILADRLKIFIVEEFTETDVYGSTLLNLLDGTASLDQMLVIATTNYPGRIPMNLIDRPGRLDSLYLIRAPIDEVRRDYLVAKFGFVGEELESLVRVTKGYSLAYIKELVVRCRVFDQSPSEVIELFRKRKHAIRTFDDECPAEEE